MCNLLELQILNIEWCRNLSVLPEGIHRLESLQQLLTEFTEEIHFPQGVAELSGLRALTEFGGGSGCNKLGWLKNLNRLTGSLTLGICISSIGDLEEMVEDAREAELRNKIHLQSLDLFFDVARMDETKRSSSLWMDVIETLEPNQKLKSLLIRGYKGSRLPDWMSSPLNFIKEINLVELSELSSLPPMGKLPFLEVLDINGLDKLKSVGREFLGIEESLSSSSTSSNDGVVVAFPKLKELTFYECNNWEEWSDITAEEEESADVSIMPCLTRLNIKYCGRLKELPHRLLRKTSSSLQILNIEYSSELLKSYQDKDGSPWRSISQYNPKLQLQNRYDPIYH